VTETLPVWLQNALTAMLVIAYIEARVRTK